MFDNENAVCYFKKKLFFFCPFQYWQIRMDKQAMTSSVVMTKKTKSPKRRMSYGMNVVHVRNTTLRGLLKQCYKYTENEADVPLYYRDVVNIGIRLHDVLKQRGKCSCALIKFTPGTPRPVCCVVIPQLRDFTRCSTIVLPQESLFVAENDPTKDEKKAKPPKRNLLDRKLCLILMFYNATYERVEMHHYPIVEHIGMLEQDGIFILDYNETVAREVWSSGVNQSYKMKWKASDPKGSDLQASANYAARRRALPRWFGIKAVGIWDLAQTHLGFNLEDNYSSGYSLEGFQTDKGVVDPHPSTRARGKNGEVFVRQGYAPEDFNYGIIRECAIHSAMDFSHLFDMVDKEETLGSEESPIRTPGDASRISDAGFFERRQVQKPPESSGKERKGWGRMDRGKRRDRLFIHSIEMFYKRDTAERYAYKYRLPMFAHDKTSEGTRKYYGVMGSWLEAYRAIRLRSYEAPTPSMFQAQRLSGRSERDQPSFHDCMPFSHECYGGPRRIKLFIDMDAKLQENPQFLTDPECPELGMDMKLINQTTRATIRWFTNFVNAIFGSGTCSVMDWVVTCATHLDRVISRHACLDKPGCYFNSMLDLMAFMYLAEMEQLKEIRSRNPTHDFNVPEGTSDISWMLRRERYIDSMTQVECFRYTSVVDFSVYNRANGNIRCVFCPKASDPDRVLNPLIDLFPGENCHILNSQTVHPKDEQEEFKYFLRNMVTFVERTDEQKHDEWDGWKLPLGAMGGILEMEDAKIPQKMFDLSKRNIERLEQGDDSMDAHSGKLNHFGKKGEQVNQIVIFLAALPKEAWYATSTIPHGACMERIKQLISEYRSKANMTNRKRKTHFGAFKYAKTVVVETSDPTGAIKTIRSYFSDQTIPNSGHHMFPWSEECKGMRAQLFITDHSNRKDKAKTLEEIEREKRINSWKKRRRFGLRDTPGSFHRAKEEEGPVEVPITKENKWDYYLVLLRRTSWCPIREKRMGKTEEGHHGEKGKGYLKIYRDGRVCYHCYSGPCEEEMHQVYGVNSYYWQLPYLSMKQRKNLWAGV